MPTTSSGCQYTPTGDQCTSSQCHRTPTIATGTVREPLTRADPLNPTRKPDSAYAGIMLPDPTLPHALCRAIQTHTHTRNNPHSTRTPHEHPGEILSFDKQQQNHVLYDARGLHNRANSATPSAIDTVTPQAVHREHHREDFCTMRITLEGLAYRVISFPFPLRVMGMSMN